MRRGKAWNPDRHSEGGLHCQECRTRVPWKKLKTQYEVIGGSVYRSWFCHRCGTQLRQDDVTYLGMLLDEKREDADEVEDDRHEEEGLI